MTEDDPPAPDPPTPLFSVVLPVHDQAGQLDIMVRGHVEALRALEWSYELLLVTNGCRDDSPAVARRLSEEHPTVRALDLPVGGWGRAVRAGLQDVRGTILCYANSARTTPEMLALHLAYAKAYPAVVLKANRKVRDGILRRLGSLIYNLEARVLFDLPWWDINGTPKVFPREFSRLLDLRREDDLIDLEFSVVCKDAGYPLIEVPVLATERIGGSSTTNLPAALHMYLGAIRLRHGLARQ